MIDEATILARLDAPTTEAGWPSRSISAGIVGDPCLAVLAYSLRGFPAEAPQPRLSRIFALGHKIEDMVLRDLRRAGIPVMEKDAFTGKQFTYQAFGGLLKGKADGLIEDPETGKLALLEIKSMNDALHTKCANHGVKISHPKYYAQMQFMMGLSGIRRSLLVAYNKDNSAYLVEEVGFDEFYYGYLKARSEAVLAGVAEKVAETEADWRCRGCRFSDYCWQGAAPEPACKNCVHAAPEATGEWWCKLHARKATEVCDDHRTYRPMERGGLAELSRTGGVA